MTIGARCRQSAMPFTMKYKAVNATLECVTVHAVYKPRGRRDVGATEGDESEGRGLQSRIRDTPSL